MRTRNPVLLLLTLLVLALSACGSDDEPSAPAAAEEPATPLSRRINQFGRYVLVGGIVLSLLVVGIGLLRGLPTVEILMVAVSQLVAMVPEGLPALVTIIKRGLDDFAAYSQALVTGAATLPDTPQAD